MSLTFHFSEKTRPVDLSRLESFKKIISNNQTQFFTTHNRLELKKSTQEIYQKFKERKFFVHIGIGGSSLGPEMLIQALKKNDRHFIFINNIDPDEIYSQIKNLNPADCLFYFVSKSGGTAETMAALAIITNFLTQKNIALSELKNYFVFATDPQKSELLEIGGELHIACLEVPSNVGGRFCVLTPVGFLPALFADINIDELILGANSAQKLCLEESNDNLLIKTADFLYDLKLQRNIDQTVLMPYSSKLRAFSFWFTQLWAESLGKKNNLKGEVVNVGFTPIISYGATDQHSQMQLFMEGPNNKCLILLEVKNFDHDYSLHSPLKSTTQMKLSSFSLTQLMKAEFVGTLKALAENERPTLHIQIEKNDEFHLGELIIFLKP